MNLYARHNCVEWLSSQLPDRLILKIKEGMSNHPNTWKKVFEDSIGKDLRVIMRTAGHNEIALEIDDLRNHLIDIIEDCVTIRYRQMISKVNWQKEGF